MLDKTVDKFVKGRCVDSSGFSENISFADVVAIYENEMNIDRIVIRQWKDGKEIKSTIIEDSGIWQMVDGMPI